jgi:hypothetical protein
MSTTKADRLLRILDRLNLALNDALRESGISPQMIFVLGRPTMLDPRMGLAEVALDPQRKGLGGLLSIMPEPPEFTREPSRQEVGSRGAQQIERVESELRGEAPDPKPRRRSGVAA